MIWLLNLAFAVNDNIPARRVQSPTPVSRSKAVAGSEFYLLRVAQVVNLRRRKLAICATFWIRRQINGARNRNAVPVDRHARRASVGFAVAQTDHRRSHDAGARLSKERLYRTATLT